MERMLSRMGTNNVLKGDTEVTSGPCGKECVVYT